MSDDSAHSSGGTDRTCGVQHCAADPCVLHREDEETTYVEGTKPIDEPVCDDCDTALSSVALAGGGDLDCVRHKFECPGCGIVVVVEARAEQRRLSAFAGGEAA